MDIRDDSTIAVAMSGGVDSSTVAAILRAEGHPVVGLTLQLWNQRRLAGHEGMPEAVKGRCCSLDDVYDARAVAEQIGIPYYVVNQQERFESDVVRPFVNEYLAGRTPIPCTLCNNHLKFDQLLLTARQIGAYLRAAMASSLMSKLGALFAQGGFRVLKQKMDPRRVNGGTFLGLNGIAVKSHGGTDAFGFASAVDLAYEMADSGLIARLTADIDGFHHRLSAASGGIPPERSAGSALGKV